MKYHRRYKQRQGRRFDRSGRHQYSRFRDGLTRLASGNNIYRSHEFYQSYTNSRESAIRRIKKKFDNIDRRIQRMEDTVTSREFEL
ncbi:MAG: hypothetical protein B6230_08105 [Desulfobacteraceae bacterium 4572_89]|nr:MAG: hypothetical protein B6230_08105 [Desulfobacteraceae bacterium 4572_89]